MKKIIFSLLALVVGIAHADPYDVTVRQRNAADTGYLDRFIPFPAGGASCLFSLDGPSILPNCYTLGAGLSLSGGVLSVASSGGQLQSDWTQSNTSSADYIKNKPTSFAPSAHTHLVADISDSGAAGRAVVQSASADTARAALLLGTASIINAPTSGNAGPAEAVIGTDTRLSDARTPTSHLHAQSDITGLAASLSTKQNAITLTTTGTGSATLVGSTLNIPTPSAVSAFNFSQPSMRSLSVNTSYQATDNSKAAVIYPSYACQNATTVLAASGCTIQVRMGTGTLTCSTGTVYYTQSLTVALGVLITQNSTNPVPIFLPSGASFIFCPSVGTFTISAVEQSAG